MADCMTVDMTDNYADSFTNRELTLQTGLKLYLDRAFSEYLDVDQRESLKQQLVNLRNRSATDVVAEMNILPVASTRDIRNIFLPSKTLRRDELALAIYSLAPYSLLSRKEAAQFAKLVFPEFFGSVETINTLFSKLYGMSGYVPSIPLELMPDRTPSAVEEMLYNLATATQAN